MLLAKMDEHHYSRSNPKPVRFPLSKHLSKEKNISEVAVISRLSVRISLTAELIDLFTLVMNSVCIKYINSLSDALF